MNTYVLVLSYTDKHTDKQTSIKLVMALAVERRQREKNTPK